MNLQHLNIEITVKINDLIIALQNNRDAHVMDYEEARKTYFDKLRSRLGVLTDDAREGVLRTDNYAMSLVPPVNAVKMYDEYIRFLQMSQEDTMKISTTEYNCFVADEWSWAQTAKMTNSFYTGSR